MSCTRSTRVHPRGYICKESGLGARRTGELAPITWYCSQRSSSAPARTNLLKLVRLVLSAVFSFPVRPPLAGMYAMPGLERRVEQEHGHAGRLPLSLVPRPMRSLTARRPNVVPQVL